MAVTLKNFPIQKKGGTTKLPPLPKGETAQRPVGPELTLKMIRDGIPAKYFKQHTATGFYYVARDFAQIFATAYAMYTYVVPALDSVTAAADSTLFTAALYTVVWNVFWFLQGLTFTGLWVLAHECGHRAFSPSVAVNDAVGWVLHSALLVPFHAWRISHGTHHKKTNHIIEDTVFVPEDLTPRAANLRAAFAESPLASVFGMVVMVTVGWPAYLLVNIAGNSTKARCNHFEPSSPLFRPSQRRDIIISNIGMVIALGAIAYSVAVFGAWNVFAFYGMPYLWTNHWLVLITFLQHTDSRLPHYDADEWTFLRGALAAIDRDYGSYLNWQTHYITNSHVMHHAFSTMPFYHAIEVTQKYVPELLGDLHLTDAGFLPAQAWKSWTQCRYVVSEEGVSYFRR
jgi:omega-6 fatty acid desaturase (delta-12 desaturase)